MSSALAAQLPATTQALPPEFAAACEETRQKVASGELSCMTVRQDRANHARHSEELRAAIAERHDRQTERELLEERLEGNEYAVRCMDRILASECSGATEGMGTADTGGGDEGGGSELQKNIQALSELAGRFRDEAAEMNEFADSMETLVDDSTRSRAEDVEGAQLGDDAEASWEELGDTQQALGLSPPPGTHLEQGSDGYLVVSEEDDAVRYRVEPDGQGGYESIPTPGVVQDEEEIAAAERMLRQIGETSPDGDDAERDWPLEDLPLSSTLVGPPTDLELSEDITRLSPSDARESMLDDFEDRVAGSGAGAGTAAGPPVGLGQPVAPAAAAGLLSEQPPAAAAPTDETMDPDDPSLLDRAGTFIKERVVGPASEMFDTLVRTAGGIRRGDFGNPEYTAGRGWRGVGAWANDELHYVGQGARAAVHGEELTERERCNLETAHQSALGSFVGNRATRTALCD